MPNDPTDKREASLQRYLGVLKNKGALDDNTYKLIRPCGSNPARLYGLSKLYKQNIPLHPIVSAIGSYTYNLPKFLTDILKPIASNKYTVKDSFSFTNELLSISSVTFMCSFDVVSLFTNIPIDKTIDICLNKLFQDCNSVHSLTWDQFQKLLIFAVKQDHFVFEGKHFDHIEEVTMGSKTSIYLANKSIFMCWKRMLLIIILENNHLFTDVMLMMHS